MVKRLGINFSKSNYDVVSSFFRGPCGQFASLIFDTDVGLPSGRDWSDITNDVPLSNILIAVFLREDITTYKLH